MGVANTENDLKPGLRIAQTIKTELLLSGFETITYKQVGDSIAEGISTYQFDATKPSYVPGAAQSLKTRKIETNTKPAVWSIDDDDAIEDIPLIEKESTTAWS